MRTAWRRRIYTVLLPVLFGAAYQVSQLMAGVNAVQQFGFVCSVIFWICSFIVFLFYLLMLQFSVAVISLVPLLVFIACSLFFGLFRDDICFLLDRVYLNIHQGEFLRDVQNSGNYINDQDLYSAPERTLARERDFSELGKFIVFQEGYIPGWQRLIVYDESDQVKDRNTSRRYIGEICVPRQGWKEGDPLLCATDNDGSLLVGGIRKVKVRRLREHFFSVYVEE